MLQLQSVLLPTEGVCNIQELYFHKSPGKEDFDGYFNLFYLEKRKKYTKINNLYLKLNLKGYKEILLFHNQKELKRESINSCEEMEYSFEFPYNEFKSGFFSFSLIQDLDIEERIIEGAYYTELSKTEYCEVNIGIDICTFKREAYIKRNLGHLQKRLLNNRALDIFGHLKVYIIDNGRTLQNDVAISNMMVGSEENIQIYANENAGGVGGFTRGMLEILKEKEKHRLTHVLLMDDDAIIETDSLVRLYGLLVTIKEEWKQAAVGGGIFREEHPEILYTAGEWWDKGTIITPNPLLDMRLYKNCTCDYIARGGFENQYYSGWWFCCYPLTTVNEENLPLPLFIHLDDIEYGIRNADKGIIYMNGIDVWHRGFELTMPRTNLYYDVRNNLILLALYCGDEAENLAQNYIFKMITSAILRLKYKECEVIYKALLDFLKGPDWLLETDPADLLAKVNDISYKLSEYENLSKELSNKEYEKVTAQIERYCKSFGLNEIRKNHCKEERIPRKKYFTYNGWILPAYKEIAAISVLESPFAAYRKKKVVIFEPLSKKYIISRRSYRMLWRCLKYNFKSYYKIKREFSSVQKSYTNKKGKLSNAVTWENYLKLNS